MGGRSGSPAGTSSSLHRFHERPRTLENVIRKARRVYRTTRPISMADSASEQKIAVLFVCLGNICRSPLADGIFRKRVEEADLADRFEIDSAGTGNWHVGERPDQRMRRTARRYGISLDHQRARQVGPEDFDEFDHLFAMDRDNLDKIEQAAEEHDATAEIHLFRDFDPDPGDGEVPDPYYRGQDGFEEVYEIVERTCEALLDHLVEQHDLDTVAEERS